MKIDSLVNEILEMDISKEEKVDLLRDIGDTCMFVAMDLEVGGDGLKGD